jgi:hypothetical protein
MTTLGIHQPGYLPWLGFFKKMSDSDVFVFLDDIQYERRNWQNRNYIRTSSGSTLLTIPTISNFDSKINEVKIDNTKNWALKHKKSILTNYSKSAHFEEHKEFIEEIYERNFDSLIEIDIEIIKYIMKKLEIKTRTVFSSELHVSGNGSDRVLNICKAIGCDHYISGVTWAKDNLRIEDFTKNGITVQLKEFQHPMYRQCYHPFVPNMAAIDLLFNEGKNSQEILKGKKFNYIKNE